MIQMIPHHKKSGEQKNGTRHGNRRHGGWAAQCRTRVDFAVARWALFCRSFSILAPPTSRQTIHGCGNHFVPLTALRVDVIKRARTMWSQANPSRKSKRFENESQLLWDEGDKGGCRGGELGVVSTREMITLKNDQHVSPSMTDGAVVTVARRRQTLFCSELVIQQATQSSCRTRKIIFSPIRMTRTRAMKATIQPNCLPNPPPRKRRAPPRRPRTKKKKEKKDEGDDLFDFRY